MIIDEHEDRDDDDDDDGWVLSSGDTTWEMSWLTIDSFDPPNLRAWGRILIRTPSRHRQDANGR